MIFNCEISRIKYFSRIGKNNLSHAFLLFTILGSSYSFAYDSLSVHITGKVYIYLDSIVVSDQKLITQRQVCPVSAYAGKNHEKKSLAIYIHNQQSSQESNDSHVSRNTGSLPEIAFCYIPSREFYFLQYVACLNSRVAGATGKVAVAAHIYFTSSKKKDIIRIKFYNYIQYYIILNYCIPYNNRPPPFKV